MANTKKAGFVSRVMNFFGQEIDKSNVKRLHTKAVSTWKRQIELREYEIEQLDVKIEEAQEGLQDTILNVDLSAIKSADARESYIENVYQRALVQQQNTIEALENEKADHKAAIARFNELLGLLGDA